MNWSQFPVATIIAVVPWSTTTTTPAAAEHYGACPDNIDQGVGSIRAYARSLVSSKAWAFWWD